MTDPIALGPDTVVQVVPPAIPTLTAALPTGPQATVVPVAGPAGPPGSGVAPVQVFHGDGPPGTVLGAIPGSLYIDDTTGMLYQLT